MRKELFVISTHSLAAVVIAFSLLWTAFYFRPVAASSKPTSVKYDCSRVNPQIYATSSVDHKTYRVDICSIVDSAEGEDFRTEVK